MAITDHDPETSSSIISFEDGSTIRTE